MKLTKAQREQVRQMFGGLCAYCGCQLGERWHADHFQPVMRFPVTDSGGRLVAGPMTKPERDCIENMMPACAPCNIYKHSMKLEHWRNLLNTIPAMLARDSSTYRHGIRFGLIAPTGTHVQFHFEKVAAQAAAACMTDLRLGAGNPEALKYSLGQSAMTDEEQKNISEQVRSAAQYLCDQGHREAAAIPAVAVVDLMVGWHRSQQQQS